MPRSYEWKVMPATGAVLEARLNDLDKAGFDIFYISQDGTMEQSNKLMPGQTTIIPLFTVVARKVYGKSDLMK